MKRHAKRAVALLVLAGLIFGLTKFVISAHPVIGDSMAPTLKSWDLCVMRRVHGYQPQRGEIIMFRTADDPPLYFIKRVIGLPGDTVSIERGVIKISGEPLIEPYTTINAAWEMPPTNVSENQIFVLGDQRTIDRESYVHGLVATRLVKARLLWSWRWKK